MEGRPTSISFFGCLVLVFLFFSSSIDHQLTAFDVGVVLDKESLERKDWDSISMAMDEFYAVSGNVGKRAVVHPGDSQGDVLGAASAVLDLLNNVKVKAMIGPTQSSQTEFISNLRNKTQVPIICFSATSPSLTSTRTHYFVRAMLSDSSLVGAISAVVKLYGWREVLIYEDTNYGSSIVTSLTYALNLMNVRVQYCSVLPLHADDVWLDKELFKMMTMQTRVFIDHMMQPDLGSHLFQKAQAAGLMNAGAVWIATDGLTNFLDTLDPAVVDSMEGVLGVHAHVERSSALSSFCGRWPAISLHYNPTVWTYAEPTIHQLLEYDAAWTLAPVVERAGNFESGYQLLSAILGTQFRGLTGEFRLIDNDGQLQTTAFEIVNMTDKCLRDVAFWSPAAEIRKELKDNLPAALKEFVRPGDSTVVPKGWKMLTAGKKLKIGVPVKRGLNESINVKRLTFNRAMAVTGYFFDRLEDEDTTKLGGRVVAFESSAAVIRNDLELSSSSALNAIIWPEDSTVVPKCWEMLTARKKLKIGVPVKRGFKEFINVEMVNATGTVAVTGYCIDVFKAVMDSLPYSVPFEYLPFDSESYDDLVSQVYFQGHALSAGIKAGSVSRDFKKSTMRARVQKFDAVVGDTPITKNGSFSFAFPRPYTEPGVSMLVPVNEYKNKDEWTFLKPMTTDLWLGSLAFYFYTAFVIWAIEHPINEEFQGSLSKQIGTALFFTFSTMFFAQRESLKSNAAKLTVIVWMFVVFILTTCYTAIFQIALVSLDADLLLRLPVGVGGWSFTSVELREDN